MLAGWTFACEHALLNANEGVQGLPSVGYLQRVIEAVLDCTAAREKMKKRPPPCGNLDSAPAGSIAEMLGLLAAFDGRGRWKPHVCMGSGVGAQPGSNRIRGRV